MKKIALFADVQNLYYTVRQAHGCHFHYAELWRQVAAQGEIVEARAYAIDRGDARQRQFQQILRNLGFTVKLKPYIQRSDGSASSIPTRASILYNADSVLACVRHELIESFSRYIQD